MLKSALLLGVLGLFVSVSAAPPIVADAGFRGVITKLKVGGSLAGLPREINSAFDRTTSGGWFKQANPSEVFGIDLALNDCAGFLSRRANKAMAADRPLLISAASTILGRLSKLHVPKVQASPIGGSAREFTASIKVSHVLHISQFGGELDHLRNDGIPKSKRLTQFDWMLAEVERSLNRLHGHRFAETNPMTSEIDASLDSLDLRRFADIDEWYERCLSRVRHELEVSAKKR